MIKKYYIAYTCVHCLEIHWETFCLLIDLVIFTNYINGTGHLIPSAIHRYKGVEDKTSAALLMFDESDGLRFLKLHRTSGKGEYWYHF